MVSARSIGLKNPILVYYTTILCTAQDESDRNRVLGPAGAGFCRTRINGLK